jgi:hypothetical protein
MILSRRFVLIGVARFLAVWGLFFLPLPSAGQEAGLNLSGASNCAVADFDANVQIANGPGNYYAIIIDKRNISNHPCIFDGPMYGPSFVPHSVSETAHSPCATTARTAYRTDNIRLCAR